MSSVQGKRGFFWNSRVLFPGRSIPNSALLPVRTDVPPDPGFLKQIAPYQEELHRLMEEETAFSDSTLEGIGATQRSTNLGNLLCDILREGYGTDISLLDSDLLEGKNLPMGVVRGKDLLRLLDSRSNQQILTGQVSGEAFLDILEESVAGTMEGRPLLIQAAGVVFEYDTARPSGRRIVRAWVRGSALERQRIYSLVTPSSLLSGKTAGSAFSRIANVKCTNRDFFSVILEGVRKKEKISWRYEERAVRIISDFREKTSQGKTGKEPK
ncbi:MAG: 5'-nucleotidase C-terminal domain-containing protein [Armatimonadetes bacterium]|nr:5'-nucleotidase C-terminal domain-containing protein [Armatimonadota bacterium]